MCQFGPSQEGYGHADQGLHFVSCQLRQGLQLQRSIHSICIVRASVAPHQQILDTLQEYVGQKPVCQLKTFCKKKPALGFKKKNVFSQLSVFGYLCVFPALETIFFYVVDLRDIVVHCAAETTLSKDYINFVHTHLHQGILRARRDFIPKVVQFPLALSIQTLGLHCTTVVVPAMCTCSISVGLNLLFHESKQLASVCQFICHCSVCFQPWQQTQSPFLACQ